jgi:predicted transcriptional regulator
VIGSGLGPPPTRSRGLWFEMLCLMHDGVPYGHLSTEAGPISQRKLAHILHASGHEVGASLRELTRHGVLSRTPEGVIFSRRMVRDKDLKTKRAEGGVQSLNHRMSRVQGYP